MDSKFFSELLDSAEFDDLQWISRRSHLSMRTLELIYRQVLEKKVISYNEIIIMLKKNQVLIAPKTLGKYVAALKSVDDVHISFKFDASGYDGRYLVYAPNIVAELCKKRHISLLSFIELNPVWEKFYSEAEEYYNFRQKCVKPPETMTNMKLRYQHTLEGLGFNGTSHKYVRTALDNVVIAVGDMRRVIANCEKEE